MGIFDQYLPLRYSEDSPWGVAEQEDLAAHTLDGEVLFDLSDEGVFRLRDHVVGGVVRDRACVGKGCKAGAPPRFHASIYDIPMQVRPPPPFSRGRTFCEHLQDLAVPFARQAPIRVRTLDEIEHLVFPVFSRRTLRYDLLAQHVQRPFRDGQRVERSVLECAYQRHALDQFVPRQRKQPPLWRASNGMPRSADSLEQHANRARGADLAHQVDRADVDAQLEGCRRYAEFHVPLFELHFCVSPPLVRHASVVGDHMILPQLLRKLMRQAFDESAGVHEQQGRAVLIGQFGYAVERAVPQLMRRYRSEFVFLRHLDGEVDFSGVSGIDDQALGRAVFADVVRPDEESSHLIDGFLSR